jgi:hypothetical protein
MPKIRKGVTADLGTVQRMVVHLAWGGSAHQKWQCHPSGWATHWLQVWLHFSTLGQPKLLFTSDANSQDVLSKHVRVKLAFPKIFSINIFQKYFCLLSFSPRYSILATMQSYITRVALDDQYANKFALLIAHFFTI